MVFLFDGFKYGDNRDLQTPNLQTMHVPCNYVEAMCAIIFVMGDDVTFFDLFDPKQPRSDKELIEYRLSICKVCPAFRKNTQQCTKCGCFMQLKTTLTLAKCPIGKW